jgi:hypothetical protein
MFDGYDCYEGPSRKRNFATLNAVIFPFPPSCNERRDVNLNYFCERTFTLQKFTSVQRHDGELRCSSMRYSLGICQRLFGDSKKYTWLAAINGISGGCYPGQVLRWWWASFPVKGTLLFVIWLVPVFVGFHEFSLDAWVTRLFWLRLSLGFPEQPTPISG